MKHFYSLLLLLSISFATLGQTSNFSRADDNEFEAKLVRVFEWVLDARFSQAQRQELSGLVATSKRANDQADLKTFQEIAKLNDVINTIPPDREAQARAAIQTEILKELRKQPNDPAAKLLLSVYNGAHSQNSATVSQNVRQHNEHDVAPPANTVPSEIVGEWHARRGSGSSYYNPNSGSYGAPNGTIDSYKFFANGMYEHAILIQNSLYNCTIRVFGRETGKTWVDGNTLTITPGPGTFEYTDNCRPNMNSKKATQMDQKKLQWQLARDEYGLKLCFRDEQGASACYYRQ